MSRQVPRQLNAFSDPGRAMVRSRKSLGHVERRPWGAVATVPSSGEVWTVGAFLGRPSAAARVASSFAERTVLGRRVGDYPWAALVGLATMGVAGVVLPITFAVPMLVLGVLCGLPLVGAWRELEARRMPRLELDDELRLLVELEKDGLVSSDLVGRLLGAVHKGAPRDVVVTVVSRAADVLNRRCPADLGVRAAVEGLLGDFVDDPAGLQATTLDALGELSGAVDEWLRSRMRVEAAADAPVAEARRRDREATERARRQRARSHLDGVVGALRSEARVQSETAEEID